ncbi:probable glutamine-dependent NAD(+) synthetase [Acidimicrobiaceae bacterium]|nr:probable glutamine-dependent NAD(+) synthetase [Acidimicrobiaceae bacterium]
MADFAKLRVGLAQINPTVGALSANVVKILDYYAQAVKAKCEIVAFPELSLTGYPPEDLVLKDGFVADNLLALAKIVESISDTVAVIGFVDRDDRTDEIFNAAAICRNGAVLGVYRKHLLPNYNVFDEQRYFTPGVENPLFTINEICFGVTICEDIWQADGPVADQAALGAVLNININGSPFHGGKLDVRQEMISARAKDNTCVVAYVNQIGGQDELVFDGGSMIMSASGSLVASAAQFAEELLVCDLSLPNSNAKSRISPDQSIGKINRPLTEIAQIHAALVIGTRDYVLKNGFTDVVIGLSGGVDSAVVAAIAVEALGAEHVHGVSMPSRYSSTGSRTDAQVLASSLGVEMQTISIEPAFSSYLEMLDPSFANRPADLTEENLQSRVRGTTLMALSNKFGWMVLTTGNKSETAVGYCTLYGDSVGGYAVIKDLFKTKVYELCEFINLKSQREVISRAIIEKAPSAELRPDQRDDQSLPPYDVLDSILELYVEDDRTAQEIIALGFDSDLVKRISRLVDVNEYKRRQGAPGVRVSTKAFGKDRRLPITNKYSG